MTWTNFGNLITKLSISSQKTKVGFEFGLTGTKFSKKVFGQKKRGNQKNLGQQKNLSQKNFWVEFFWGKLYAGTVPANKKLFGGTLDYNLYNGDFNKSNLTKIISQT